MKTHQSQHRTRDDAIDPALEALLDEALASPAAPAGMADRMVGATEAQRQRAQRPGVLARVGLASSWRAAASVAVVGFLGWMTVMVVTQEADGPVPGGVVAPGVEGGAASASVLSEQEARELLTTLAAAEGFDFESFWLDQRFALSNDPMATATAEAEGGEDPWAGSHDPMDALLDTFEAERLGDEQSRVF